MRPSSRRKARSTSFEGFASEQRAAILRPAAQRGHGDAGAGRARRFPNEIDGSCRSMPARRCAGASPARSGRRRSSGADNGAEMVFEPFVTFARVPFEPGTVGDPDHAAAGRDQILVRSSRRTALRWCAGRRAARQGLLRELDAVAGPVLRVQQPARGALRNRVVGIARDGLHHLRRAGNRKSGRRCC